MKFIEIDETYVNLLHNYSKSDPQKPQKFQSSQETLHLMFRSMLSNLANAHLRLCLHLLIISVRLFSILFPLWMVICSFSFKQSRHHFVLTLYGWYCPNIFHTKTGSYFEALIFQSLFDSCVSFFYFLWLKDFLWFKYHVLKHFSCKGQSVFLIKLHVLLWKLTGGWRIFLLCELMDELMADLPIFVAEDCCASSMNLWVLKKVVLFIALP